MLIGLGQVLAMDGRWVLCGLLGGPDPSPKLLRIILSKRLRLIGTTLRSRPLAYQAALTRRCVSPAETTQTLAFLFIHPHAIIRQL